MLLTMELKQLAGWADSFESQEEEKKQNNQNHSGKTGFGYLGSSVVATDYHLRKTKSINYIVQFLLT